MLCKNCGITLPYNTVKCPKCGADLQQHRDIKIFAPTPEKPSSSGKILVLFILLIIAGSIIYFKMPMMSNQDTETEPIQTSQTTYQESLNDDTQELIYEAPESKIVTDSNILPDAPAESPDRETAGGHLKKEDYKKTKELTEIEARIEEGFQQKEGSHFVVKFEGGGNADIGHLISIIMEEAYMKVGLILDIIQKIG